MHDAHIVNKEITTSDIKKLLIVGDAVDTIRFYIPRTYNGKDLSTAVFHCKFLLPSGSGDMDLLTTSVSPDGVLIYADWDVRGNATTENGKIQIQVVAVLGTDTWQSKPTTIIVDTQLDPEELGEFTSTILEQYLTLFQAEVVKAKAWADEAEDVEVETGKYSSKHWAAKAAEYFDNFHDTYLGAFGTAPTQDNDGDPLVEGMLYWNTTSKDFWIYNGSAWQKTGFSLGDTSFDNSGTDLSATTGQDAVEEINTKVNSNELAIKENQNAIKEDKAAINSLVRGDTVENSDYGNVSLSANVKSAPGRFVQKGLTASQKITNGDFSNGITGFTSRLFTSATVSAGILTLVSPAGYSLFYQSYKTIVGHKYFGVLKYKPDSGNGSTSLFIDTVDTGYTWATHEFITDSTKPALGEYGLRYGILTAAVANDYISISCYTGNIGDIFYVDYGMVFDLTAIYGSGNEPSEADCLKIFRRYFDNTQSGIENGAFKNIGKNLFDKTKTVYGEQLDGAGGINITPVSNRSVYERCDGGDAISFQGRTQTQVEFYDEDKTFLSGRTSIQANIPVPNGAVYFRFNMAAGDDINAVQVEYGGTSTDYVAYREYIKYYKGLPKRSVPAAADEIYIDVDGKLKFKKNVDEIQLASTDLGSYLDSYTNVSLLRIAKTALPDWIMQGLTTSDDTHRANGYGALTTAGSGFDNLDNVGTCTALIGGSVVDFVLAKGAYTDLADAQANFTIPLIQYQLDTPVITEIETSGDFIPQPNGVCFHLPWIPDVQEYNSGFSAVGIENLIAIKKIGTPDTILDVSDGTVGPDSFTHSEFSDGDWGVFIYDTENEHPEGLITVTSWNDNEISIGTVNGTVYRWKIEVDDTDTGSPIASIVLEEV